MKAGRIEPLRHSARQGFGALLAASEARQFDAVLEGGFARVRCDACREEYIVAFSCKQRGFCPSCSAKRAVLWEEFVREHVARQVPHRHFVFALPKSLRPAFRYRRSLLQKLALCAWNAVAANIRSYTGADALPGAIVLIL